MIAHKPGPSAERTLRRRGELEGSTHSLTLVESFTVTCTCSLFGTISVSVFYEQMTFETVNY